MPLRIIPDVVNGNTSLVCNPNTTMSAAASLMLAQGKGAVVISDHDVLAGIFTERDVSLRVVAGGLDTQTAILRQVMTADPTKAGPTKSAAMSWT